MKATCIRDCTTPTHGMVTVGKVIEVPDGATVEDLPYLKHFSLEGAAQAASADPAPEKPKPAVKAGKAKPKVDDFLS